MDIDKFFKYKEKKKKQPVCHCRHCARPMYENPMSADIGPNIKGIILDDMDEECLKDLAGGEKRPSDVCSECFREKAFERSQKHSKYNDNLH